MKIIIVSSSPNEIGLTNSCVEICKEALEEKDHEVFHICLNHYQIKKCEACGKRGWGKCLNEHSCVLKDDFSKIQNEINQCDAMVLISPVYFYEMSESAKTFFDRFKRCESFKEDASLKGKNMLCIAAAGGSGDGTENTLHSMKILAKFLHMNVVDTIGITKKNYKSMQKRIKEATYLL